MRWSKLIFSAGAVLMLASAGIGPVFQADAQTQTEKAATANAALPAPQVEKIREYFKRTKPQAEPIEASRVAVSMGSAVPSDIAIEPLPGAILVDFPPGVDYGYFVHGADIVVVNAETRTVVGIVRNVG